MRFVVTRFGSALVVASLYAFIVVVNASCATIFSDNYDTITIDSEPQGADVYWRDEHIGRTPFTYQFKRQTAASYIEFAKKGYGDKKFDLSRRVAPAAWLNLAFLTPGSSSWGTDVSSGAMWQYAPNSYVAKLVPADRQETWNETVMEYVLANEDALKKDIARGSGEAITTLCSMIKKPTIRCQTYTERAKQDRTVASVNALEFYRALRAIDIEMKNDDL